MTKHAFDREITALLVIDPYNDFTSEGGKACRSIIQAARRIMRRGWRYSENNSAGAALRL